MHRIQTTLDQIKPTNDAWQRRAELHLDGLTKPPGSLGRLEDLASWFVRITEILPPQTPHKAVLVFAADHGIADAGVSAYPKAVTAQMVGNFLAGGAAVNVLARQVGADLRVIDMGVDADFPEDGTSTNAVLINHKIARGTQNMVVGSAMKRDEAIQSLAAGIQVANDAAQRGVTLLALGEMGIANTSAATAITAVCTQSAVADVCGTGTGIDPAALLNKQKLIQQALDVNQPNKNDAIDVLAKVGGFELGGMAGCMIGAAAHRIPVILDGFISTAAALIAVSLKRDVGDYLLAGHQSTEPGHQIALRHLSLSPLLDFNLRLGEGTGAVLAMGMVDAAIKIMNEMASFASAGVSGKTESP